jgi:hypothetical protein
MEAISSADKAHIIFLLIRSFHQESVVFTGLGKSTVGIIYQQLEKNKENCQRGRPFKCSPAYGRRIVNQITTGN